jgi:hypothetical protein
MEIIKLNFDKILLTVLTVMGAFFVVYSESHRMSGEMVAWAQSLASGFCGALLTLITGSRFAARAGDSDPKNGGKSNGGSNLQGAGLPAQHN